MSVWDQCISRGAPGWIGPAGYNNAYQIVQTPEYVVVHSEMIHDARIIPLDGRPPLPSSVRLWEGDSRGRWEGDTLVVETTNFSDRNWIATSAASGRIKGGAHRRPPQRSRSRGRSPFRRRETTTIESTNTRATKENRAVEGVLRGARYQERSGRK